MNFKELNTGKNKLILLGVLSLLLVILFILNRFIVTSEKPAVQKFEVNTVSTRTPDELKKIIPSKIDSIASLFAIKKEWIADLNNKKEPTKQVKGKNEKNKKSNTPLIRSEVLWFSKEITVPKDVSAAEFNLEMKTALFDLDFDCTGIEDPKSGNLVINVFNKKDSSQKTIGNVNLTFSDKIKRDAADVCLILNKVEENSIPELEKLLSYPDKFTVVLPDIVSKIDAQTVVLDSKRDYVLFADIGTEDDLLAEFKPEMSQKEWKSKVRTMCYEYDKASAVLILNPKKIQPFESDLLTEFSKYNLKAYKDTILVRFNSEEKNEKKINTFFNDVLQRSIKGARSIVYLVNFTNDEVLIFRNESFKLKRKGFKFFTLTELMKRRQKTQDAELKQEITG